MMLESGPNFEHQKEGILPKSYLLRIFFLILLLIILGFYFIQNNFISFPYIIISKNHSYRITIKNLSERNSVFKSNTIRCVVYVRNRDGRLGNRMFMIASAYGLARLHHCHLYLTQDILDEIQQIFVPDFSSLLISSTMFEMMNQSNLTSRISKDVGCQYIRELTRPNAISKGQLFELIGYWQSYLHFIKYANELRENIFIASSPTLKKVSQFFLDIYQEQFHIEPQLSFDHHHILKQQLVNLNQTVWIGIHVRRRDFVHLAFASSDEYLLTAIQYYTEYYSNAYFIVASDDRSYCQNLFKNRSNIFITPAKFSPGDDLITLSLCEHSITTGGTFGWWAAFLANGHVIHDKVYPSGCPKREHYYPPWFIIDGYVRAHKDSNYTLK